MLLLSPAPPVSAVAATAWPARPRQFRLSALIGPLASLAILAAALDALRGIPLSRMEAFLPASALFWMLFAARILASPAAEWLIFRRLWGLPVAGFAALLRKLVSNELLFGYSGELLFYAWARQHLRLAAAPFGAIKDSAVLSAIVGNASALLLVALTYPLLDGLNFGVGRGMWLWSLAIVAASSLGVTLLRRRLFSLPARDLRFVASIHVVRVAATTILTGVLWHLLLPDVPLTLWLLLATVRQLVSRLPLLPNKDVVFAGMVAFVAGGGANVATAMALMATLTVAAHVLLGLALGARGLVGEAAR